MAKKKKTPAQAKLEAEVKKERKRIQQFVRRARKRGYTFPESIVPNLPKKITEKTLSRYKKITPQTLYEKAVYISPEGITVEGTKRRVQERYESAAKAKETREKYYIAKLIQKSKQNDREIEKIRERESAVTDDTDEYWDDEDWKYEFQRLLEEERERAYEAAPSGVPTPTDKTTFVLDDIIEKIENWSPSTIWSESLKQIKEKDKNLLASTLYSVLASEGREAVARRCNENAVEVNMIVDRVLYDSGNSYYTRGVDGVNQDIQRFAAIIKGSGITIRESREFSEYGEQLNYED